MHINTDKVVHYGSSNSNTNTDASTHLSGQLGNHPVGDN